MAVNTSPVFSASFLPLSGGTLTGTLTTAAVTLGGAVAGGDQAFTNVGDMTFAAGSILASGSTNGNTLLIRANDTTFITLTTGATDACELAGVSLTGTTRLTDADIAHGITNYNLTTDCWGAFDIDNGTNGGMRVWGLSDDAGQRGLALFGLIGVTDPTDTTPAVAIIGAKKSGAGAAALDAAETVVLIENWGTTLATMLGSGQINLASNADSASVVDLVGVAGYDLSAGNRSLAISTEHAVAVAAGVASTHKVGVRWNGATYYILLSNV